MDQTATPAPAPTETHAAPPTAAMAAVTANDFGALRAANRAERTGKPAPVLETPAETPAVEAVEAALESTSAAETPVTPERQLSKRQQQQNDAIRAAVDRATADLRAENDRLRTQGQPPKAETPAPADTPEWKRLMAHPQAPKLETFDGDMGEYMAAVGLFVNAQIRQADAQRTEQTKAVEAATQTITAFHEQIKTAGNGDPETFLGTLSPEVQQLQPVEALHARGAAAQVGPLNILASHIVQSAHAPQLLQYFSEHPAELQRFRALPSVGAVLIEFGKVDARLDTPSPSAPPPAPKTLTSAPPPPTTFGSARPAAPADPMRAAVTSGDFGAFRAARRAERLAQRA